MCSETEMLITQDLLGIKNLLKKLTEGIKVAHIYQDQKYKVVIERAASTKGVDGFKVEANGDSLIEVEKEATFLYEFANNLTHLKVEVKSSLPLEPKIWKDNMLGSTSET